MYCLLENSRQSERMDGGRDVVPLRFNIDDMSLLPARSVGSSYQCSLLRAKTYDNAAVEASNLAEDDAGWRCCDSDACSDADLLEIGFRVHFPPNH